MTNYFSKLFSQKNCYIFTVIFLLISHNSFALENLVYTWRGFPTEIAQGTTALNDLKNHAKQIDILSSQAYHINEKGTVYGEENTQMLKIARDARVKIMPLVGNSHFDREKTHLFLHNAQAQTRAIQSLLNLCEENHFYGLQIDFEGMSFLDRDAFTAFYQKVATTLHQHGYQVSIAIIPAITDTLSTEYLKGHYEGWSGVYDYKALGEASDFVTLMAYDQQAGATTPGPMAGASWDETIIQYALRFIKPEKLSLGIPWHSGYWYTGKSASSQNSLHAVGVDLNYVDVLRIMRDHHATLSWNNVDQIHYAIFQNNYLYEYLFFEDAASFKAKLALIKKYHLRGMSNWCLGEEDPAVWDTLPVVAHH